MRGARVLAPLAFLAAASAAAGAPSLVADPPEYDCGVLCGDTTVSFLFTLRNEGDEPLHIAAVDAACGCTSVFLPDSLIPPRGALPLTGSFSSRKMRGDVRKTVTLTTDDPGRPAAILLIRAWVLRDLTWAPRTVRFFGVRAGEGSERTVLFRPGRGVPFTIEGVQGPAGRYDLRVTEGERLGDRVLHVVLLPTAEAGALGDTIRVRTNVEGKEEIVIPVEGRIDPPGGVIRK
ncbi:MAG: DUF1573 domain-containing protein [Candidatus Eisenbacteria bacterium]